MRVVLQRVKHASVQVDGAVIGEIGQGFLILLGVSDRDDEKTADQMADKICRLRIFEDENGKTNRSLADVGGSVLVVSQFTLYADCRKGNRPGFTGAGSPEEANIIPVYTLQGPCRACGARGIRRRYEGGAFKRRSLYVNAGQRGAVHEGRQEVRQAGSSNEMEERK